jgi:hypothetical protein
VDTYVHAGRILKAGFIGARSIQLDPDAILVRSPTVGQLFHEEQAEPALGRGLGLRWRYESRARIGDDYAYRGGSGLDRELDPVVGPKARVANRVRHELADEQARLLE